MGENMKEEELKKGWGEFKKFLIEVRGYTEEEAKRCLEVLGLEE